MNPMYSTLVCSAALAAGGAFAAPHAATASQSPDDVAAIEVHYESTDLANPEILYRRIQGAARQVCHEPDIRELQRHAQFQMCYDSAVDNAVAKVNATALTALHRSKTQRSATG